MNFSEKNLNPNTTTQDLLQNKILGIPELSSRYKLHSELHAGPCELISAPIQVSHLTLLSDNNTVQDQLRLITQLCSHYSVNPPAIDTQFFSADFGSFRMRWERHNEFSSYTFFIGTPFDTPFSEQAIHHVPKEWLASLPGEIIAAIHIALDHESRPQRSMEELSRLFASNNIIGAKVAAGSAVVWTDNKIHPDGFSRILIHNADLSRRQAGRLIKRLLDIETYRMLAMLPVPMARQYIPEMSRLDQRLAELTSNNTALQSLEDEQQLLHELTLLAAEIESISATTNQRFSATSAYFNIVKLRISELREQRIQGLQMFQEFMEQRMTSAMNTCESVHNSLETLSVRVARASSLLRTRVEISMEKQSRDLLKSMDKRARMQLRLQETVEGLSVVVLTYYLLGIVNYGLKALKTAGMPIDLDIASGLAIPVVFALVFFAVRRLRRMAKYQIE